MPGRDLSTSTGTSSRAHVCRNADTSSFQEFLSKSIASSPQVSSRRRGYTPITCRPWRWSRITWSVTVTKAWFGHDPQRTRGFSQIPRTQSLLHAGEYPVLPVFRVTQSFGKTSARPRKSWTLAAALDFAVTFREPPRTWRRDRGLPFGHQAYSSVSRPRSYAVSLISNVAFVSFGGYLPKDGSDRHAAPHTRDDRASPGRRAGVGSSSSD